MTQIARSAFVLTTLVVLLMRGLRLAPDDLAVAGASGLLVYAVLAFGGAVLERLARAPRRTDRPTLDP